MKKYADIPDITQTVDYVRVPLYDLFNGNFLGFAALYVDPNGFAKLDKDGKPEIKKAANGQPIIATKDNKASWVPTGEYTEYPEQGSPDLTKYGYKKVRVLDSRTEDDNDGGKVVDHKASDPTKDGADVNGSPDSTHVYKQSVTFTRKAIIDSVTKKVVRYTDWTSDKPEMGEVPSKKQLVMTRLIRLRLLVFR